MINQICANIKNYFTFERDKHVGVFAIVDGDITPSFLIETDYIRIVGSHFNDGVHKRDITTGKFNLKDEGEFRGGIWVMSPPDDFLSLVKDISDWQDKYGGIDSAVMSPFQSESFGGYSYSKVSGYGGSNGASVALSWQDMFASRLNMYRRIRI